MEIVSRVFLFVAALLLAVPDKLCAFQTMVLAGSPSGEFTVFEENGRVGLRDGQGLILIPPQYEALGWSDGSFSLVSNVTGYRLNGAWGLIHLNGSRMTPGRYTHVRPGGSSVIIAGKKIRGTLRMKTGCVNPAGKEIIPFEYDDLVMTSSLRAVVMVREGTRYRHGLIDLHNNIVIPISYKRIYPLGSLRYAVENFDHKTAVFTEGGVQLIDFVIDSLSTFRNNHAIIYKDDHEGLINRNGDMVVPAQYRNLRLHDNGEVTGRDDHDWLFLDGDNNVLRRCYADSVGIAGENRFYTYFGDKFRITNGDFVPLTPVWFTELGPFVNGRAVAVTQGRAGIIGMDGQFDIPPTFYDLKDDGKFMRGYQLYYGAPRWLAFDVEGNVLTTRGYDFIGPWNGRFFPARNRGFWGALDETGNEMIACVHDSLVQLHNDNLVVKFRGGYGIIGMDESWKVTPQPHPIDIINDSLYLLKTPQTTFLKSVRRGIIYFTDNAVEIKDDHLLEFLSTGAIWKIDFSGIIAARYELPDHTEEVHALRGGFRLIKRDNRYGFVDDRGRLRIANRYEDARDFSSSLAAVKIRGRWGFVDQEDRIAIQPVFDWVGSFAGEFCLVRNGDLYGVIDRTGRQVLPLRYDEIVGLPGDRFKVRIGSLWGLFDALGRVIASVKYDMLTDTGSGFLIVARGGKFGLITTQGVSTIPEIYDWIGYDSIHGQFVALKRATEKVVARI